MGSPRFERARERCDAPRRGWRCCALGVILAVASGCATWARPVADPDPLAPLARVVAAVLRDEGYAAPPFRLAETCDAGSRHFVAVYTFDGPAGTRSEAPHWLLEVSIAVVGGLIDAAALADATVPPRLGSRFVEVDRINVRTTYAPPGMFTGIAFSTLDQRFDVRITRSNLLPDGVAAPPFDAYELGATILGSYRRAQDGRGDDPPR